MSRKVMLCIGPPGGGKGTHADRLQEEQGFFHLESSKVIEDTIREGLAADPNDPILLREKAIWEAGTLNTPELVKRWMMDAVQAKASQGTSLIFSGSPRTIEETELLVPLLEDLYLPKNIYIIHITIDVEVSVRRNSARRICAICRHPYSDEHPQTRNWKFCPLDAGALVRRTVDSDPQKIRHRYQQYLTRTEPILVFLRDRGYPIHRINGDRDKDLVYADVLRVLIE